MSNIIPQRPKLNQIVWEHLERTEIREYAQAAGELWVTCGPLFDEHPDHLKGGVAIPSACYKILVEERNGIPRVLAFIMDQNVAGTEALTNFLTSVATIEQKTGLDFMGELADDVEKPLEAKVPDRMW